MARETKTAKIRDFLLELVNRGELDLDKSVSNASLREWSQQLKERYGEEFNVNTISNVVRELRVAHSLSKNTDEGEEQKEYEAEDEGGKHSVLWKAVIAVVVLALGLFVVFGLAGGRFKSWLSNVQAKKGVTTSVSTPISS